MLYHLTSTNTFAPLCCRCHAVSSNLFTCM